MRYICVQWLTSDRECPELLYSELDDDRYEVRKVYKYKDGSVVYADNKHFDDNVFLGDKPVPTLDEIAENREFLPNEISQQEFEKVWEVAIAQ